MKWYSTTWIRKMKSFLFLSLFILILSVAYVYFNKETAKPESLVGKNVVITGASSGIGEQLAYRYAQLGANIFITARREHLLKKVVQECKIIGRQGALFGYVSTDMANYEAASKVLIDAAIKQLGGIDHLILNHAIFRGGHKPLWTGDENELQLFDLTMNVNFRSFVYIASEALPYLYASDFGRIGVISSINGKIDTMGLAPYSSSKFALDGFFSSLRTEMNFERKNVTVTLCPLGVIGTEAGQKTLDILLNTYSVDYDKFISVAAKGDVTETARLLIDAVARGDREFYYPLLPSGLSPVWLPVLRHAAPWMLDPHYECCKKD